MSGFIISHPNDLKLSLLLSLLSSSYHHHHHLIFSIIIIVVVVVVVNFVVFNMAIDHLVQFLAKEAEKLKKAQFQISLHLCSNCARQCDCTLAVRIYHASLENIQQLPNNEMVINTKWLLPHSTHIINQPPSYPRRLLPWHQTSKKFLLCNAVRSFYTLRLKFPLLTFPDYFRQCIRLGDFTPALLLNSRSQWPRGLRRRSTVARLLRLWVRIPPGMHGCLSVVSVVCWQVEVCATDWSLVQRNPTDCGASLCVIKKPRKRGG